MDSRIGLPETAESTREAGISVEIDRRTFMTASAGLAAGCATAPWTPPAPVTFRTIEHQPIPMRDGVNLSARLWLPETATRAPAVLECVPYRKRDLYRMADDLWGPQLASAGIAFVRLDVRGSGESEGAITDEYSEAELCDCEEVIAWLARQDWCNGAVGMRGISWGGINTLQVAARRPPALKAIMPMGACDRRYTDDAHYIGGGLGHTNFQWGVLFKKVMAGPPDPLIHGERWLDLWRQRLEATPPILATWLQHQREDAYWKRGSVFESPNDINIPTYLVSGWSDTYATPGLRLFSARNGNAKLLIGPWGHTYPYTAAQGLDWAHEEVRWWRHWLMREDTGIMREPRVRVFLPTATATEGGPIPGHWIASEHWPPRTQLLTFHLNTGELGEAPSPGAAIEHRDEGLVGATKPEWLDRLPLEQSHDDARSTVFDSAPVTAAVELTGETELRLRIASDKPVAKLFLRLNDLRPDGKSWPVTWAALNLTRRDSLSAPTPLEPGHVYDVTIRLRPAAYVFRAGSRIRLALSEGFWPMLWPSPDTPTLTLPMGVSTLTLPVRMPTSEGAFPIPQTKGADPAPTYTPATPDASGRLIIINTEPEEPYRIDAANIELASSGEETSDITQGDPLSARWRQTTRSSWKRDGWACAVEASYDLTSDATHFRIVETLTATHNGAEIFTHTNDARIARDLL
jgi:uncharacterized protein